MANTILVGAQWGDEGKGKIIDFLTEKADIVVRSLNEVTDDLCDRLVAATPNR